MLQYLTFSTVCDVIRGEMRERASYERFIKLLFYSKFRENEDDALACLTYHATRMWVLGKRRVADAITRYYAPEAGHRKLAADIRRHILPCLMDTQAVEKQLYELVLGDNTISKDKRRTMTTAYPCADDAVRARYMADIVWWAMARNPAGYQVILPVA